MGDGKEKIWIKKLFIPRVAWLTLVEYEETAGMACATATGALDEKIG